ncbi:hypothetical protein RvY_04747 [Ramazzottius varieornatus]|uniref:Uncharacterized protein n=1 Tax=Ramazzottius varieornatus TaxID=947166 RepID=A0A1D1USP7_RAMVA|nr:hypothetical protein RvY_04747 [Ramazzottius varieornatus]
MASFRCIGIVLLMVLGGQSAPLVRKTRQLPGFPLGSQQILLPLALGTFNFTQPDYLVSGQFTVEDQSNNDILVGESYGVITRMMALSSTASTASGRSETASSTSSSAPVTAATCSPAPKCPDSEGCTRRVVVMQLDSSGCPLYGCAVDECPMLPP